MQKHPESAPPASTLHCKMSRRARVVIPGFAHHVTQRGNNRRDVFFSDTDRETYLNRLRQYCCEYDVSIVGYCLMTNHVHLIAIPKRENSLAKALGPTHNDYSRWLNVGNSGQRTQTQLR